MILCDVPEKWVEKLKAMGSYGVSVSVLCPTGETYGIDLEVEVRDMQLSPKDFCARYFEIYWQHIQNKLERLKPSETAQHEKTSTTST